MKWVIEKWHLWVSPRVLICLTETRTLLSYACMCHMVNGEIIATQVISSECGPGSVGVVATAAVLLTPLPDITCLFCDNCSCTHTYTNTHTLSQGSWCVAVPSAGLIFIKHSINSSLIEERRIVTSIYTSDICRSLNQCKKWSKYPDN